MLLFKKLQTIIPLFIFLFFFVSPAFAAAPDGAGPWADSVLSSSQGLMKNGLAVPAARSDTTATLGVAENDTVDSHFFSLGFGGNIVLGFDNGISSGVFVVEATNISPTYPDEKAKIEVSENGTTWVMAGNVAQDGTVAVPDAITCAKFVRITDISDPAIMPDAIADGYDVDGVQATGDSCTPTQSPTPTPTPTPTSVPSSGSTPNSSSGQTSNSSSGSNSSSSSNSTPSTGSTPASIPTPTPTTGASVFIGGISPCPTTGNPLIPCFPNTGNPSLPNTGIGPNEKNILWSIANGIDFILSIFSKALNYKS